MQDKSVAYDSNIIVLKFEDSELPKFKESRRDGYIQFGERDDYPDYLLTLLNKSSKHNAIVCGKVNYIMGGGLKSQSQNPNLMQWVEKCNKSGEGITEITSKSAKDIESFGGFYWHIIPNRAGKIAEIYLSLIHI